MSEQRLLEFRSRAEALVDLPDLEALEQRGATLRRRRQVLVASVAAAVVAAIAFVGADMRQPKADPGPANDNDRLAASTPYLGYGDRPDLDPGTYSWRVSPYQDRPFAIVDVPEGWNAWFGPSRSTETDDGKLKGDVDLIVTDVYEIVEKACQPADDGMRELGDDPQELVEALARMPRHDVLVGPRAVERFGHPATHLRVEVENNRCPFGEPLVMLRDTGIGQPVGAGPAGSRSDLWVVDVGSRPVLVSAYRAAGTPAWLKAELDEMVDSLEIVEPE